MWFDFIPGQIRFFTVIRAFTAQHSCPAVSGSVLHDVSQKKSGLRGGCEWSGLCALPWPQLLPCIAQCHPGHPGSCRLLHDRRKFRSQTSDHMDRWKSRGGKNQRREGQKREDQGRERVRRKKMQVREKVEKSRFTMFFQW